MRSLSVLAGLVLSAASFEDGDSLSLLQLRAGQTSSLEAPPPPQVEWPKPPVNSDYGKYSPRDAYWPNKSPAPDGKGDTEQSPPMAQHGPCPTDDLQPNGHIWGEGKTGTSAQQSAFAMRSITCPNTIDNAVIVYPNHYGYKTVYPDWQCGEGAEISGPSLPNTWNSMVHPGHSFLDNSDHVSLPWTVHGDNCIALCRKRYPDTNAVSMTWQFGQQQPSQAMVAAKQRLPCYCHTNSTFRSGLTGCRTKAVWLGDPKTDADGCPCTDGVALTLKKPLYSNLGGTGPDVGSPQEILYPDAGVIDGQVVSVRIWTADPYKGDGAKNGLKGSLGRLNMKTGQENTFQLAVVDAKTKEPLKLGHALPMTFLDIDEGKKGKGRATVSMCGGAQQFVTSSSELTVTSGGGCVSAASSVRGSAKDNPSSVEGALSDEVASRRVASYILESTDSGIYTFKLNVAKGWGKRNFLFTLSPGAACNDESRMPTGCAAALDNEGL